MDKDESMKEKIIQIIQNNRPDIEDIEHAHFIEDALLDSFDIMTLVSDLDKTFGISINGTDIVPDNFVDINAIEALVKKSRAK